MGEATREARQDVAAARARLSTEVDELELAARSAADIPAKIRKNPAKVAALGGGAVFLAAGGPRRLASRIVRVARRPKKSPVASLLPEDVGRIVEQVGAEAGDVRSALEASFARWLEENRNPRGKKRKTDDRRTGGEAFWHLFDSVAAPVANRAAKQFAERLFAAEPDRRRAEDGDPSGAAPGGSTQGSAPPA